MRWDLAGSAKSGLASSVPPALGTGLTGCLGSLTVTLAAGGEQASDLDSLCSSPWGLRSAALERDRVPGLRTHRGQPRALRLRIRDPHPGIAHPGLVPTAGSAGTGPMAWTAFRTVAPDRSHARMPRRWGVVADVLTPRVEHREGLMDLALRCGTSPRTVSRIWPVPACPGYGIWTP